MAIECQGQQLRRQGHWGTAGTCCIENVQNLGHSSPTHPPTQPHTQPWCSKFETDGALNPAFREGPFELPLQRISGATHGLAWPGMAAAV